MGHNEDGGVNFHRKGSDGDVNDHDGGVGD